MQQKNSKDNGGALRIQRHWHEAVPDDRTAHLVKNATRAFLRALQTRLAPHGVQLGHWTFLRILWEHEGLTKRDLSAEAGVMEPTTVVALKSMEKIGYVTLMHRHDNRKNIYVFLTPLGRSLKEVLVPLAEDVNTIAQKGISSADIEVTRQTLLSMIDNLLKHDAEKDSAK